MRTKIGMGHWGANSGLLVLILLAVAPAFGQNSNFGNLTLNAEKPAGVLSGSTGGSTSLPAIVSSSDRHNKKCLGYGDPTPDHILILKQSLPSLTLQVDSGGADTTLVVQGPNGVVRCGTAASGRRDASLTDTEWQEGNYKVWVGTTAPSVRRDYTLRVR